MVIDIQVAEIREFGVFQSRWFCQLNNHWLERADFRSERPDGGGGGDEQTNGWTNKPMKKWTNECLPVFYRPSSSSGSLPKNANFGLLWSFLRHFRPFFWVTVGSRRFGQGQQHTWGSSTFSYPMIFIQVQFRALDVVGGHNDGNEWWKWASLGYKRYGPFCGSAIGKSEFCSHPVTLLWYCLIASLRCKIVGAHRELGKLWDHAKKSVMKLYNLINKRKEWKISVTNWEQNLNFAVRGTAKCTLYFQAIFFLFLRWLCS